MILGVVLLEQGLLLLEFDAGLGELLSQLLNIHRLDAKVTGHGQIRIIDIHGAGLWPLRLQLMLHRLKRNIYITLLRLQSHDLLRAQLLKGLKLTPKLVLVIFNLRRASLHSPALLD